MILDIRKHVGNVTMAFAGIHVVVGVVLFGPFLLGIVRAGPGAGQPGWSFGMLAAFWFLVWSWPLFLLGYMARWAQARIGHLPAALGWGLISVASISVVFGPVSGLWLFIPFGVLALAATRSAIEKVTKKGEAHVRKNVHEA